MIKSIGRRQTRAMLEWQNRWVVEIPSGYQNRRARRAEAVRVGRLIGRAQREEAAVEGPVL